MMKSFLCGVFAVCITLSCSVCMAAQKPATMQRINDWTVNIKFEHPQQIVLKTAGGKKSQMFWYTIVELTNETRQDVDFYPNAELMTNTFQLIPAGQNVPSIVFEQIKKRHQSKYPFLESLERTDNKLLQGENNAKDIAIIWPDFDAEAKSITIFIAGLSNETIVVNHPKAKDKDGEAVKIFLRKTLQIDYGISSDPSFRSQVSLKYNGKSWVMR